MIDGWLGGGRKSTASLKRISANICIYRRYILQKEEKNFSCGNVVVQVVIVYIVPI